VVMELLEGQDLTRAMRSGALSRADLIHIFMQIADTLARAHDLGVVHRDLKPDNIFLVNEAGDPLFVKLLDFGIAKLLDGGVSGLTETGVILGTPYYMSPEQARADAVDQRTDIYALGVIMYRAFTGRLPFVADSTMGVITRHLSEPPEPPSKVSAVNPKAEVLILRCLEKRPEHRPQSMREVTLELRAMLLEEEQRHGRRHREGATVNERGLSPGSFPPPPLAAGDSYPPSGPHGSGPHGSGPHGSGPHRSGPHPSGAHAAAGDLLGHGDRLSPDPRMSQGTGAISVNERPSRISNPASFDSALTSLRWPPGTTGATGRGFVATNRPSASPGRGTWMLLIVVCLIAGGALAAVVVLLVWPREAAAPPTVAASTSSAPKDTAAPASAAPSAAVAPPSQPSSTATAAASAAPSVTASPPRPRGGNPVVPPPKPSATAAPRRPNVEIRSPFD
jgi:eukaryotic-like serine/threonine-protein kinase